MEHFRLFADLVLKKASIFLTAEDHLAVQAICLTIISFLFFLRVF